MTKRPSRLPDRTTIGIGGYTFEVRNDNLLITQQGVPRAMIESGHPVYQLFEHAVALEQRVRSLQAPKKCVGCDCTIVDRSLCNECAGE